MTTIQSEQSPVDNRKKGFRKFRCVSVGSQGQFKACRYAMSSLQKTRGAKVGKKEIIQSYSDFIDLRRKRLRALRSAGWSKIQEAKRLVFAANCPPIGVMVDQMDVHPCMLSAICPFCWCRNYVAETYLLLEKLMFPQDGELPMYDLIEVLGKRFYPVAKHSVEDIMPFVRDQKADYYHNQLSFAKAGFVLCSIEPPKVKDENPCWELKHRILAVVSSDECRGPKSEHFKDTELSMTIDRNVRRISSPNRHALVASIGRVGRYPERLMYGNIDRVIEILDARSAERLRTTERYGKLRRHIKT